MVLALAAIITTATAQVLSLPSQPPPDSVVAVLAGAQGLPFVPPDQRPVFGTFWEVHSSLPCLGVPLPFPPLDPATPVYAIGDPAAGQFLVDETAGQVISPQTQYVVRAVRLMSAASILQAQAEELQNFVAQVQARQAFAQLRANRQMSSLSPDGPPPSPGEDSGGADEGGSGTNLNAYAYTTNDLWLEITWATNNTTSTTAAFTIHLPLSNPDGVSGLYMNTNLCFPHEWTWVMCNTPGQTNLVVSNLPPNLAFFRLGPPTAIRPGYDQQSLGPNDDDYTGNGSSGVLLTNLLASIGFTINLFGITETNLYVNNNGNVTLEHFLSDYTPVSLEEAATQSSVSIIAPFWADVDTRGEASGVTTYGTNTVDGHLAFGVSWIDVGYFYYYYHDDKWNTFQLVLVDRSDRASGDYDVEFNYAQVQWETGDASGGSGGLGGSPARAGFASGTNQFELAGSGFTGFFLDMHPSDGTANPTGLIYTNFNSTVPGRYVFQFHQGSPLALPPGNPPQTQLSPESRRALYSHSNQLKGN